MGIIERSIVIEGSKKSKRVIAFFDSGSSFSIIRQDIVDDIGYLKKKNVNIKIEIGDGKFIFIKEAVGINIKMNKNNYLDYYLVSDEIPEQVIIGVDFLQKYGHTLEFKNDKVVSKHYHLKNRRGNYVM